MPPPAIKPKAIGRDKRFRIVGHPENDVVELQCHRCGHNFNVRELQANYFFTCASCHEIGNLPGVLAHRIDIDSVDIAAEERAEWVKTKIAELQDKYKTPEKFVAPPPQERKQST